MNNIYLKVFLHSGVFVPKTNLFKPRLPNLYCKLKYEEQVYTSQVFFQSNNPEWNESFQFKTKEQGLLKITLYRYIIDKEDPIIGTFQIGLPEIKKLSVQTDDFAVKSKTRIGSLRLSFQNLNVQISKPKPNRRQALLRYLEEGSRFAQTGSSTLNHNNWRSISKIILTKGITRNNSMRISSATPYDLLNVDQMKTDENYNLLTSINSNLSQNTTTNTNTNTNTTTNTNTNTNSNTSESDESGSESQRWKSLNKGNYTRKSMDNIFEKKSTLSWEGQFKKVQETSMANGTNAKATTNHLKRSTTTDTTYQTENSNEFQEKITSTSTNSLISTSNKKKEYQSQIKKELKRPKKAIKNLEFVFGFGQEDNWEKMAFLNDGKIAYRAGRIAIIYDPEDHSQKFFTHHKRKIVSLIVSKNRRLIATASLDGLVCIWDYHNMQIIRDFKIPRKCRLITMDFSYPFEKRHGKGSNGFSFFATICTIKSVPKSKSNKNDNDTNSKEKNEKDNDLGSKSENVSNEKKDNKKEIENEDEDKGVENKKYRLLVWNLGNLQDKNKIVAKKLAASNSFKEKMVKVLFNPENPMKIISCGDKKLLFHQIRGFSISKDENNDAEGERKMIGGKRTGENGKKRKEKEGKNNNTIKIRTREGNWVKELPKILFCALFASKNEKILTGTSNGNILVWSAKTREIIGKHKANNGPTFCLSGATRQSAFISGGKDGKVSIWGDGDFDKRKTQAFKYGSIVSLDIHNGVILLATSENRILSMRSLDAKNVMEITTGAKNVVSSLSLHPSCSMIAVGTESGDLQMMNLTTRKQVNSKNISTLISQLQFSPGGKFLALGLNDGTLTIVNSQTLKQIATKSSNSSPIAFITWSANSKLIAVAHRLGAIIVYKFGSNSLKLDNKWDTLKQGLPRAIDLSTNRKYLRAAVDNKIIGWRIKNNQILSKGLVGIMWQSQYSELYKKYSHSRIIDYHEDCVALPNNKDSIQIYQKNKLQDNLHFFHTNSVRCLLVVQGSYLISTTENGKEIYLWRI